MTDTLARPLILLTNDDGYDAPGLLALATALRGAGELAIVAPDHNWSASGHSLTLHKPMRARSVTLANGAPAIITSGSPSDCVTLAFIGLIPRKPDLVISGINHGANVGLDLTYSGTVAGAMESVIGGVTGIAASLDTVQPAEFDTAARWVARLAQKVLTAQLDEPLLLNVNVPALPEDQIKGVEITRLGKRIYRDALVQREDPRGRPYYWIGGEPPLGIPEPGTDIGALANGYVSVTPLLLDLTHYGKLAALESLLGRAAGCTQAP